MGRTFAQFDAQEDRKTQRVSKREDGLHCYAGLDTDTVHESLRDVCDLALLRSLRVTDRLSAEVFFEFLSLANDK